MAIVAGKSVGGAVVRNRAKRRLRAAVAEAGDATGGRDIVVIARPPAVTTEFPALRTELVALVARATARAASTLAVAA